MVSQTSEATGNATSKADQLKHITTNAAQSASDAIDAGRGQVVDAVDDATDYVRNNPVTSLLVLGAVVIGGSLLVAAMLREDRPESVSGASMALASAAHGLGPRGTETLSRIRDAAFSFALDKIVDTVEEMFPGFRQHYERG
jgi:ElaB/YqjD/DUF883 family membrane-anchored ribosome-binding protein